MRAILISILLYIFYVGFFTFSKCNTILLSHFSDRELHFLAFLIYPFLFFLILPKNKTIVFLNILLFGVMTFGVEVLQRKYFHRSYSLTDFKYSFSGFMCALFLILHFSNVISNFFRVRLSS